MLQRKKSRDRDSARSAAPCFWGLRACGAAAAVAPVVAPQLHLAVVFLSPSGCLLVARALRAVAVRRRMKKAHRAVGLGGAVLGRLLCDGNFAPAQVAGREVLVNVAKGGDLAFCITTGQAQLAANAQEAQLGHRSIAVDKGRAIGNA